MKALIILKRTAWTLAAAALSVAGCKPDLDAPTASKGNLDFSRYVAFGNSLTAGFADNGLYRESQLVSYPNLIAGQLKIVGGGEFEQPLFPEAKAKGTGYLTFKGFDAKGSPILETTPSNDPQLAVLPGQSLPGGPPLLGYQVTTKDQVTPQNMGIPAMHIKTMDEPSYKFINPYFQRMFPDAELATYLTYAGRANATFFTCWMGSNDVLGFALRGGNSSSPYDVITPPGAFRALYTRLMDSITRAKTVKGALATIPDVTSIPFFTTVTNKAVIDQASVGAPQRLKLFIQPSNGPVREARDADLILLTTQAAIGRRDTVDKGGLVGKVVLAHGFFPDNPLQNGEVLDSAEASQCRLATEAYNQTIKELATAYDLALFDANDLLRRTVAGIAEDGITTSTSFISGGAFSLDAVHLTPRGNAIVANGFIRAINVKYGLNIPTVNINQYRGVLFPQ